MYTLTPEEDEMLVKYVNGESDAFLDTEGPEKVMRLARDLSRKMAADLRSAIRERDRLRAKAEALQERRAKDLDETLAEGAAPCTGLSATDVAWAVVDACRRGGIWCSRSKLLLFVYECYCSWMGSKKERLCVDEPVISEYGPQFWSVFKRVDPRAEPPEDALARAYGADSGIRIFVERVTRKYAGTQARDLAKYYIASEPYRRAAKAGGGKTNTRISDADIYRWARARQ